MTLFPERKTTVSLVLGSGGARGMANIGIIQELEERGLEIASVSGCSIGTLIGGVYAAGKLKEFENWVCCNHQDGHDQPSGSVMGAGRSGER